MRYFYAILGLLILIAALGGIKGAQISSLIQMGKAMEAAGPPPEAVGSGSVVELEWEGSLSAVGSVVAERGVAVSNESPGMVTKVHFDSGDTVKPGQVLVELDSSVERAQLDTLRARLDLARQTANRTRSLAETNTVTQAKVDADEAQLKTAQTELDALKAQIDRKVVRAPFAGKLGIRAVNLGQYLNPGTTVTTLEALDSVFVDFSLPQQALATLENGMPVRLKVAGDKPTTAEGKVAAIDPSLDEATRSIRVRASVPNQEQKLRPGMFVDVAVVLPSSGKVVAVPATAIVHASYGDSLFVIEEPKERKGPEKTPAGLPIKQARQQFVKVGEARGDFVAVLEGVKPGQQIVTAGAFKLRNNAPIAINDRVKIDPKVAPNPENR
ncbi:MAG: efflux RND transporter periplasmic adaptor subunit [Polyangiales bacterium]